ncbi:recombinase family protein, partial [Escherichia coli]|uniref:recombinase family protein n=1 Tax=Escherichia coli TaxID=562 RepID=UPI001953E88A
DGETPREIAKALNAERIPAPRGGVWMANTIAGNVGRGGGLLRNPIYEGRIEWGRARMVLDPKTGRR